jgi:hypothetical protein
MSRDELKAKTLRGMSKRCVSLRVFSADAAPLTTDVQGRLSCCGSQRCKAQVRRERPTMSAPAVCCRALFHFGWFGVVKRYCCPPHVSNK